MNFKFQKAAKYFLLTLVCITTLNFYGCEEDNIVTPTTSYGYVSVYHTYTGGPNVNIEINGIVAASNVSYLQRLPYQQLTSGNNRLKILAGSTTVIDTTIFLSENNYYSVFVYGKENSAGTIIPTPLVTTDDLSSPGTTNASVRFISFAPQAGSVNLGASSKTNPWFSNSTYAVPENFRPITGGVYNLYMNMAFTPLTLATLIDQDLQAGKIYTIIGKGIEGASGNQAIGLVVYPNQ